MEKLSAELSKKTVQMDMMETTLYKVKEELEQSKKALADLRKVRVFVLCTELTYADDCIL